MTSTYRPPLRDIRFVLDEVVGLDAVVGDRAFRSCRRRHRARRARRGRAVHGRRRRADEPRRRPHRLRLEPGLHRHDARELQARLQAVRAHRLRGGAVRSGVRRRRLPVGHGDRHAGDAHERQHGVVAVPAADAGRDRGAARTTDPTSSRHTYLPRMLTGEWTGHDEPHRAAGRQRRRRRARPRAEPAWRRLVAHQRPEDLHHVRRARSRREHRAPGAGPHARLAARHEGDLDVPRAQVPGRRRRFARRAQRRHVRVDRAQVGDPRQSRRACCRSASERRDRLARRRRARGHAEHVHDDEHRPPVGRTARTAPSPSGRTSRRWRTRRSAARVGRSARPPASRARSSSTPTSVGC